MVEDIWRKVASRRDLRQDSRIKEFPPLRPLNHDLERHFINARCVLDRGVDEPTVGKPLSGMKRVVKRRAAAFTMAVLRRYLDDEKEFLAHMVRFQNNVADAHDQLANEVAVLHRGTLLECERLMAKLELLEESVQDLRAQVETSSSPRQGAAPWH